jgi:ATP-dependent Lon protease
MKGYFATGTCGENDKEYTKEKPLLITNEDISNYLGSTKITYKTVHNKPIIGMVNGIVCYCFMFWRYCSNTINWKSLRMYK